MKHDTEPLQLKSNKAHIVSQNGRVGTLRMENNVKKIWGILGVHGQLFSKQGLEV